MKYLKYIWPGIIVICFFIAGCVQEEVATSVPEPVIEPEEIDRESKIPPGQEKITPETDLYPPILHSDEYEEPVPMPYPINTAGAEDSGFIMPDGKTFYIWFTPDPNAPLGEQLDDGVTGIYVAKRVNGEWQQPQRVLLQDTNKQALDGCAFVLGNKMWFCTARTGYTGVHWFTAEYSDGKWTNWTNADFNPDYGVGELHITTDGKELYLPFRETGREGEIRYLGFQTGKWRVVAAGKYRGGQQPRGRWLAVSYSGRQ